MKYTLLTQDAFTQKTDCLVIGLSDSKKTVPEHLQALDDSLNGLLSGFLKSGDVKTGVGDTTWLMTPEQHSKRLLFVGTGKTSELNISKLRKSLAAAMAALSKSPASSAIFTQFDLSGENFGKASSGKFIEECVQALAANRYVFDQCKSKKEKANKLKQVKFAIAKEQKAEMQDALTKAQALAKGMALTKDLGNLPGNICTPDYLAKQAKGLAKQYPDIKTTVLGEKEMKQLGMGSFLSVAAGSAEPPRLITMEYHGGSKNTKPHVLVGKGITFDTGGISLKPGAAMDEMKFDMCGAASVFGTLTALAEMQAPVNVVGVIAAAENMPGSKATKPGDIVTSMSGQTIEILNTDAEGRLVLCDALTYCEKFEPETVVDIATLTGACIVALGREITAVLANNDSLANALTEAGDDAGDKAWQLPLYDEYQALLDSNFADMQNIGGPTAGTITAACFLSRFTKKYKWAHLDIAGVAWKSNANKGATGRPVPLLTEYLLSTHKK